MIKKTSKRNFNFEDVGIKPGSILTFKKDKNIVCKVISKTEVEYEGKVHSLSSAGVLAIQSIGYQWKQIQGTSFWLYKGEILCDIRERLKKNIDVTTD